MHGVSQPGLGPHDLLDFGCIGPVYGKTPEAFGVRVVTVDAEFTRRTSNILEIAKRLSSTHGILRHLAVRGPLPTGDRDQTGLADPDRMLTGGFRGIARVRVGHKRSNPDEDAQHVVRSWIPYQVARRVFDDELDLIVKGHRLLLHINDRRVSRPDEHPVLPRDGEQDAVVIRLGDHDRG